MRFQSGPYSARALGNNVELTAERVRNLVLYKCTLTMNGLFSNSGGMIPPGGVARRRTGRRKVSETVFDGPSVVFVIA
jgi:hypothetical protein